ncbi:hypothetical protein ACJMCD_28490 (plasmid) [Priestia megaterium]|uniref:hypothetical protein n=1 Tax=Priestia megaterium TaxID=1404 RepID=UPI00389990F8
MPQNFVGKEYEDQVRKMVDFDEGKSISKDDIAEQLAENNKDLTEIPGEGLPKNREDFWPQAAKRFLDRLAEEGVLKNNGDGTYTKK